MKSYVNAVEMYALNVSIETLISQEALKNQVTTSNTIY